MRVFSRLFAPVITALLTTTTLTTPSWEATPTPVARDHVRPLERAHAHNDYEHPHPLYDALAHGFTSVEADVWLVKGKLLIGHDRPDPKRTLQNTYLDPLRTVTRAHRGGVYRGYPGRFRLYLDVKTGPHTWPVIEKALSAYPDVVTRWTGDRRNRRPVEAVISGNRNLPAMKAARTRWSAYDGRMLDLLSRRSPQLMPVVSDNWSLYFTWKGEGQMPAAQRRRLHRIVDLAHRRGYEMRFWATPDAPGAARDAVWRQLVAADVDQINTDDLPGLARFLRTHNPRERRAL